MSVELQVINYTSVVLSSHADLIFTTLCKAQHATVI